MNLSRLLVTGALAATVTSAADEVAAQSLNNDASFAFESGWTSGYMGLGGGLVRAMPKHARAKDEATVRPSRRRYAHARRYDPNSQIVLIADTLDHTGLNIAHLGSHAGLR